MLFARQEEAFGTAIPCKNVRNSIKGRTVEQCSTQKLTMESAITDNPDASSTTDDQRQGSSSTADGRFSYSVNHNYLSKRSYPAHFSKKINVLSEKGHSTLLVLKMESCITSAEPRVSVHVNSKIVYTQNLCSASN